MDRARVIDDQTFDPIELIEQRQASFETQYGNAGGQRIGEFGIGAKNGHASHTSDGEARSGIEDVGVAHAVNLDEALVVARRHGRLVGDLEIGEHGIARQGIRDADGPRRTIFLVGRTRRDRRQR